jgi:hypothetical protein
VAVSRQAALNERLGAVKAILRIICEMRRRKFDRVRLLGTWAGR